MDSVETDRLILRPFAADDGPKLHRVVGNDPDMTWDATDRPLERTEETLRSRIMHFEEHGFGVWAVIDKTTGELIGQTGLQVQEGTGDIELVAYTAKRRWKQGIGREACIGALTYGFTELSLPRIVAATRTNNIGGQRLAKSLGFRSVREDIIYGDPVFSYELLPEEFKVRNKTYLVHHEVPRGELHDAQP